MTWCPVLSPVLAHWSEDWVMLSLQAKPNEKSWETPLLCCQGFAPKRTQPRELTLCWQEMRNLMSPQEVRLLSSVFSSWVSDNLHLPSSAKHRLPWGTWAPFFLIFVWGKSVTFRDWCENQACSWAAHFSTVKSVLVMASWVFRFFLQTKAQGHHKA